MKVKSFIYTCVICGNRLRGDECNDDPVCSGTEQEPHIPIEMEGG